MTERNEWRNYTPGQWRQLAHQQADDIEALKEYRDAYREQFITLQTDYKKLEAENERLRVVYDAAIKIQPELTLVSKVLRKAIQEDGDDLS